MNMAEISREQVSGQLWEVRVVYLWVMGLAQALLL